MEVTSRTRELLDQIIATFLADDATTIEECSAQAVARRFAADIFAFRAMWDDLRESSAIEPYRPARTVAKTSTTWTEHWQDDISAVLAHHLIRTSVELRYDNARRHLSLKPLRVNEVELVATALRCFDEQMATGSDRYEDNTLEAACDVTFAAHVTDVATARRVLAEAMQLAFDDAQITASIDMAWPVHTLRSSAAHSLTSLLRHRDHSRRTESERRRAHMVGLERVSS